MTPDARSCLSRWPLLVLALVAIQTRPVRPMGTEEFGNKPVTAAQPEWPAGILQVINDSHRVYSRWVNGNEEFFFTGSTEDLNVGIQNFAACAADVKELFLLPVPGETRSLLGDRTVAHDWRLHVPSGIYLHMAKREKETKVFTRHATITVHVREKGIRLDRLLVPAGVKVLDAADLLGRYRQGLGSTDAQVRGQAAHLLHTLGYVQETVDLLAAALADKDEYVRRSAAGALGLLGAPAARALPALRQARAKENERAKKELDDSIAAVEAAKPLSPDEDTAARRRLEAIAAFKRARAEKSPGKKE